MNTETLALVGRVAHLLETSPNPEEIQERIRAALDGESRLLYTPADLAHWTGWSVRYIQQLCAANALPHIPGKPHRFLRDEVEETIRAWQIGGRFRRRVKKDAAA